MDVDRVTKYIPGYSSKRGYVHCTLLMMLGALRCFKKWVCRMGGKAFKGVVTIAYRCLKVLLLVC